MDKAAAGLCALLVAAPALARAEDGASAESGGFELAKDANEFGIWGGGALSVTPIGGLNDEETDGRRIGLFSLRYGRVLLKRESFALEYVADLIPFAVETNNIVDVDGAGVYVRETAYGAGVAPLGARMVFRLRSRVKPYVGVSGGFLLFDQDVPLPGAKRFAWTADLELGGQIWVGVHSSLNLGVRFHHASNGNTGAVNPGVNAFVLFAGFSLYR